MRVPRARPNAQRVDRVLAVACGVGWLLQVAFLGDHLSPDRWVAGTAGFIVCAGLAMRRRYPFAVGVGTQALMVVTASYGHLLAGPVTVAWFCALYALAVWTTDRLFIAGVVLFIASDVLPDMMQGQLTPTVAQFTIGATGVMLLVRVVVGGRDRQLRLAQREREVAAREAVVEERARIARELHDVVAHHVSTMVVQAGAERHVLGPEQQETKNVLGTIEGAGRSALAEMRRMVSMLRGDSAEAGLTPQPVLADVSLLVDQVRSAGLPVQYAVFGEVRELPLGIELSSYRIIQEALTNAIKHAGEAHARVEVRYEPDNLEILVSDDGRGTGGVRPPGGHGLVGMRERVEMYGGTLSAARNGAGFTVRAVLPVL